jgi:oxysterol 7-alpha-hydroxylase
MSEELYFRSAMSSFFSACSVFPSWPQSTNRQSYLHLSALAAAGIAVTSIASAYTYHFYLQHQRQGEAPIKKSWIPYLGFALEMGSRPVQLFQSLKKEFGEIFGLVVLGSRMFIITDPHSYPLIISASPKELSSLEFHESILEKFFGVRSMAFTIMDAKPGLSKHLFADSGLVRLTERMQAHMVDVVKGIQPGRYNMYEFVAQIVHDCAAAGLVNTQYARDPTMFREFGIFDKGLPAAAAGIDIKYLSGPLLSRKRLGEALLKCRENESPLMASRWEQIEKLIREGKHTISDAVGHQVTMMWASMSNTMPSAFWLIYFLLSNNQILSRVREEITTICGPDSDGDVVPLSKLNQLVLLNACITETLRLTSGTLIMRIVQKPLTITLSSGRTYRFRKGDSVGICATLGHLDNEIYDNANNFVPDRWLVGSSEEELMESSSGKIPLSKNGKELVHGVAFLPFGGGASLCPGRKFARTEIKALAVHLLRTFNVSLDDNRKIPEFDGSRCGLGIFPPKGDVYINVLDGRNV